MVWNGTRFHVCLYIIARLRKPELIIRENQPIELPPEVVRGRHQCALQISAWCTQSRSPYLWLPVCCQLTTCNAVFLYINFSCLKVSGILSRISVTFYVVSVGLLFNWAYCVFLMQFMSNFRAGKNCIVRLTELVILSWFMASRMISSFMF
jgi:hypothetical protein